MSNSTLILWALPVIVFLSALVLLTRQASAGLSREHTGKPAGRTRSLRAAAAEERAATGKQEPWYAGQVSSRGRSFEAARREHLRPTSGPMSADSLPTAEPPLVPTRSSSSEAVEHRALSLEGCSSQAGHDRDPFTRTDLARLCREYHIRAISLLPSPRHSCVHDQANLEILVDFEARARVDYTAYFRLRQDLFKLAGRQVDLICKNTASLRGAGQDLARAQVLYAA